MKFRLCFDCSTYSLSLEYSLELCWNFCSIPVTEINIWDATVKETLLLLLTPVTQVTTVQCRSPQVTLDHRSTTGHHSRVKVTAVRHCNTTHVTIGHRSPRSPNHLTGYHRSPQATKGHYGDADREPWRQRRGTIETVLEYLGDGSTDRELWRKWQATMETVTGCHKDSDAIKTVTDCHRDSDGLTWRQ